MSNADAQRLDLGDQQRRDERAGNRSHAADHHDHERIADRIEIERQVRRHARHLQRAAEPREKRAAKNTPVKSHAWLMPSAPSISRSPVAARTSVPQRVRVSAMPQRDEHEGPMTTNAMS